MGSTSSRTRKLAFSFAWIWGCVLLSGAGAGELSFSSALESIRSDDVKRHVDVLADDSFEGREAGSRGGRAAGNYLQQFFVKYGLTPAGDGRTFYQMFHGDSRNILGLLPGRDDDGTGPVVVVGAHYDHVGYGNRANSFGPFGYVHNGADDNASGTAALLEVVQAFSEMKVRPRHSILFVLWDGEEKGLLGSKYWVEHPTIDRNRVRLFINLDMVGRLRNQKVEIYGTRTWPGLRQVVSRANSATGLKLDFRWEMTENSDHYTFFSRSIPTLMLHTGLHDEYHRPQDDAHLINNEGIEQVARLTAELVWDEANREHFPAFRTRSRQEGESDRRRFEVARTLNRSRLGIGWNPEQLGTAPGLLVSSVTPTRPAGRAGLLPGDRIVRFAGLPFTTVEDFLAQVQAAPRAVAVEVARDEADEPIGLEVELEGNPAPIGISWTHDRAEPGTVMLTHVTPGSVAGRAGLRALDRIYEVNGEPFADSDEFLRRVTQFAEPTTLLVERDGRIWEVEMALDAIRPLLPPSQAMATADSSP